MSARLPVRKYIKVYIQKRKNKPIEGRDRTVSYTLYWKEYGQRRFLSLGQYATRAFAERMAREKEAEINSAKVEAVLKPATWAAVIKDYLDQVYPGHDLPTAQRKKREPEWRKSFGTMKRERLAFGHFERIIKPDWCHDLSGRDRDRFIAERLKEVESPATLEAELRALHTLCELMEEWGHRPKGQNPFSGRAKVDDRRRRHKERGKGTKVRHYSLEEIRKLLDLADTEVSTLEQRRFRALLYFVAYTGCRINEALHLEWQDVDWDRGVAWLYFKVEADLKTAGSEAPFGLPDPLIAVLREWEKEKTCTWVFPNSRKKPWKGGAPGYRPFDQIQALGERAGVPEANWKKFRHSLATIGKGAFGLTEEQVKAQLRHTTTDTQKHYSHDDLTSLREAAKKMDFRK